MVCRVLIKNNEKPDTIHDFKEHKLLTINVLIINKDQLIILIINSVKESPESECRYGVFQVSARNPVTWISLAINKELPFGLGRDMPFGRAEALNILAGSRDLILHQLIPLV
jgi:hypothetical protein